MRATTTLRRAITLMVERWRKGGLADVVTTKLAVWVLVSWGVTFLIVGIVVNWHRGSGHDSSLYQPIWRVVWISHALTTVGLIIVVYACARKYFQRRA
jgi:vacuolar-type H+-ATPase subunit I/STV1